MKNPLIYFLPIIFLISGCAAVEEINDDYLNKDEYTSDSLYQAKDKIKTQYLKTEDYDQNTVSDAVAELKTDYLGVDQIDKSVLRRTEAVAKERLGRTEYKNIYDVNSFAVDEAVELPQASAYIMTYFLPFSSIPDANGTKYLVIVRRFDYRIAWAGVFTEPKGDSFYRYYSVLKEIENQ